MERRHITTFTLLVLGVLLLAEAALADPAAPLSLTQQNSSRRDLSTLADQTHNALAGNVTEIDLVGVAITQSWQGYYGDVSGHITLDDGNNLTFYNWSVTEAQGEVYASRTNSITWANVLCANQANVTAEESALGQNADDADSVNNTYSNSTSHPAFSVGDVSIAAHDCWAANMFDNNGAQTSQFFNVLLEESNNIIYTTLLNGSQTGFNGNTYDFELLVGEDGHGNGATTPYYFFVELV